MNLKTRIMELDEKVREVSTRHSVLDLFRFTRWVWLNNVSPSERKFIESVGTEWPTISDIDGRLRREFARIIEREKLHWGNVNFHLTHRVTKLEELLALFPELEGERAEIQAVTEQGFLMSMLPLTVLLPREAREKAIPKSDYFEKHQAKDVDPYGIFTKKSKIIDAETGLLLASRKFPHSALMNIHSFCPIGCTGCYKGYYTREKQHKLGLTTETVEQQAELFADWLNEHPEVYDIIISGGEPLMITNYQFKQMLERLKRAKHLKIIRVCTGTLFLGLPWRIDEELLNMLKRFSLETGKRITFNTHLANHYNITPEALLKVRRIREHGFSIYSQVPIQEGVNFFKRDLTKTKAFLIELGRRQAVAGIDPYKWIVDMHPRTLEYYVPI